MRGTEKQGAQKKTATIVEKSETILIACRVINSKGKKVVGKNERGNCKNLGDSGALRGRRRGVGQKKTPWRGKDPLKSLGGKKFKQNREAGRSAETTSCPGFRRNTSSPRGWCGVMGQDGVKGTFLEPGGCNNGGDVETKIKGKLVSLEGGKKFPGSPTLRQGETVNWTGPGKKVL